MQWSITFFDQSNLGGFVIANKFETAFIIFK